MKNGRDLQNLADILVRITGGDARGRQAIKLLMSGAPDPHDVALDAHLALLKRNFDAIETALADLPEGTLETLNYLTQDQTWKPLPLETGDDKVIDMMAFTLLRGLESWQKEGQRLAASLGRFVEDSTRLLLRHNLPLGRGFEDLFDERLLLRFSLLPDKSHHLVALHRHLPLLLEEPDEGILAIERDLGTPLDEQERFWLEVERRVATLRFVRHDKTEEGHIRWYVRPDPNHQVVLDRLGVRGHWLVFGDATATLLTQLATAVERVTHAPLLQTHARMIRLSILQNDTDWQLVKVTQEDVNPLVNIAANGLAAHFGSLRNEKIPLAVGKTFVLPTSLAGETNPTSLRRKVRQVLKQSGEPHTNAVEEGQDNNTIGHHALVTSALCVLAEKPSYQSLFPPGEVDYRFELRSQERELCLWALKDGVREKVVAQVSCDGTESHMIDFLDCIDRIADLAVPVDLVAEEFEGGAALAWTRALLQVRKKSEVASTGQLSGLRVRLVYIPSSLPHPLGGVPEVGTAFLQDHLERRGARVDVLKLPRSEYDRRIVELLGADVVGIGVYIHNRDEVRDLVTMLRQAGFTGKILLGGPETRTIEDVQTTIEGWDAIIRGEAEEVLPLVLEIFNQLAKGDWEAGFSLARSLRGVVLRYGNAMLLCETASRNQAKTISCPLPFNWEHGKAERRLKMNFTRGCPYQCVFCPNHQGRLFHAGPVDELWRYTLMAVVDDLPLPKEIEQEVAKVIQDELAINAQPQLHLALHLLWRTKLTNQNLDRVIVAMKSVIDPRVQSDRNLLESLVGFGKTLEDQRNTLTSFPEPLTAWQGKQTWLLAKLAVLASRQLWRQEGSHQEILEKMKIAAKKAFILETSEDNTLVNRKEIIEYMKRRKTYGLVADFVFNPGQNTIRDFTKPNSKGVADEEYMTLLADENPFAVALGADGSSNTILRQNRKPLYGVADLLAVNRALARLPIEEVVNNYILLTPETNLLEAIESFVLFLLLPIPWRDYGPSINLQVIKEETTLSNDEGLLFAPEDKDYNCPLRFAEVQQLLDRWSLTSLVSSERIRPLLWQILEEDSQAAAMLPLLVRRWERNFDADPELEALAHLVNEEAKADEPLVYALRRIEARIQAEAFVKKRTIATFHDLVMLSKGKSDFTA